MTGGVPPAAAPPGARGSTASPGWLPPVLGAVGGAVDAAGFIVLFGLFTAHMSGNTTGLGVAVGGGDWSEAAKRGFVVPVFVLTTAAGVGFYEVRRRAAGAATRALTDLLVLEVVLIVAFAAAAGTLASDAGFRVDSPAFFLVAALATMAMGLQNAAVRRAGPHPVHTTFVTGMLTEGAIALVQWRLARRDLRRSEVDDRGDEVATRVVADDARERVRLASAVWGAYLAGGVSSAFAVTRVSTWCALVPAAVVALSVVALRRRPSTE